MGVDRPRTSAMVMAWRRQARAALRLKICISFKLGALVMRFENPPFEAGYGFVIPSSFASWASSILTGRSLGRVQFLKRCGTTA
jgi:hypothetical protein